MTIQLSSFFDLLPTRIDEALGTRLWRRLRVARHRQSMIAGAAVSRSVATASPRSRSRLFVDMAVISKHDAGTGIQRVVRALALALRDSAPEAGWDICFVSATRRRSYHPIVWPGPASVPDFAEIEARPGDVFLGLDYSLDTLRWHRRRLARFRRRGGRLWFLVHDLLPLERPDWFSRNTVLRYKAWLDMLASLAEGFVCNSPQTEADLRNALRERFGLVEGFYTQVVPMGANILDAKAPATVERPTEPRVDTSSPYFLMVGTLEPRKGHADIVAAFDLLWRAGAAERLVLVGRQGWQVTDLVKRICAHRENGAKLLWLDDVHDEELAVIYSGCTGVVIASYAEGFGLPLVEALDNGKPVLARDLPVFRAHESHGVRYFPVDAQAQTLAQVLESWIADAAAGRVIITRPEATWDVSAKALLSGFTRD